MSIILFILCIINLILLISILSTCSDINDNLLDIQRYLRSLPKKFMKKGKS